jgi:tRNA 2-thiocytidine biosynthesis protein TtcA
MSSTYLPPPVPKANAQAQIQPLAELVKRTQTGSSPRPSQADKFKAMPMEKLERRLLRSVGRAIGDFKLIEEGDRIMVGVSGGKDSWALLHILELMRQRAPVKFSLIAVNVDQGFSGFRQDIVEDYVRNHGYEYHFCDFDTATLIAEKMTEGGTPCSLCSRMRRGVLYGLAEKLNCNKIALGHHLDDFVETLLLNQFFIGRTASMAVKLHADDKKNIVIRPLVYVSEAEIIEYSTRKEFPIVCCQCPLMCGETVHGDFKRRFVKNMIQTLEVGIPEIRNSLIASLGNVRPTHLLSKELIDF